MTPGAPDKVAAEAGELYLDRQGQLFLCVAAGTPGTWMRVALTAP